MVEKQTPGERQAPIDSQAPREREIETMGENRDLTRELGGMPLEDRVAAKEKVGEVAGKAKDKVDEASGVVKEKVDEKRTRAADGIVAAAGQLRDHAEQIPGGERTTELAQKTAVKVENAAGFIRNAEVSDVTSELERLVKKYPVGVLAAAAGVGFLIGRALRG